MGLDIRAFRGLTRTGDLDFEALDTIALSWNDDFPGRADDVPPANYTAEDSFGFRAGSYGGYTAWREQLAKLAGYPAVDHDFGFRGGIEDIRPSHAAAAWDLDGPLVEAFPFWALVNFSDCEGTIGTAVSAKLAADFAAYQEKADAHPEEYFRHLYGEWRKAFEMAADRGAVRFS